MLFHAYCPRELSSNAFPIYLQLLQAGYFSIVSIFDLQKAYIL